MYRVVKKRRNGKIRYELDFPDSILRADYKNLSKAQAGRLLVAVIAAEKQSRRVENNKVLRPYRSRLKAKRLELAKHYRSLGGDISPLLLKRELPPSFAWPGILSLVGRPD